MEYEIILIREKQFADSLIACLTTLPCLVNENVKSHTIFFLSFLDCIDGWFILGSFVLGPYCEKLQLSVWLSQGRVLFILEQSMFWWHGKFMNICVCITGIETFAITYILIMFSGELYYQGESFAFINWCCVQLCACRPWSSRFSRVIFQITLSLLSLPEHKHRQAFI